MDAGKFFMVYTILTMLCLVVDFIMIFVGIAAMNNDEGVSGKVYIYLMGVLYFMIAFY